MRKWTPEITTQEQKQLAEVCHHMEGLGSPKTAGERPLVKVQPLESQHTGDPRTAGQPVWKADAVVGSLPWTPRSAVCAVNGREVEPPRVSGAQSIMSPRTSNTEFLTLLTLVFL